MRAGVARWWWIGLLVALTVRVGWLATLEIPDALDGPMETLLRRDEAVRHGTTPTGSPPQTEMHTAIEAVSLVDTDSLTWRYVVRPAVQPWQRLTEARLVRWYWLVGGWQGLLQALACAALTAAAWQAFGSRVLSLVAAVLAAGQPNSLLHLLVVGDFSLVHCLVSSLLVVTLCSARSGGVFTPLLVGILSGALFLIRPGTFLVVSLVLVWYFWQMRRVPRGWLAGLIAFLAVVNLVGTWFAWHWWRTGEPMPIAATFWQYHYEGLPHAARPQLARELPWQEMAVQVRNAWAESFAACLKHRLTVWVEALLGQPGTQLPAPPWFEPFLQSGGLTAWRILFALGLIVGWRWSFPWYREHRPITFLALGLPVAYALGPVEGVREGLAWAEPAFVLYVALAIVGALPGVAQRLFADGGAANLSATNIGQTNDVNDSH
ncbi:hypothetical protein HRbin36_02420 [bacterium HR36]|nr:hypothetical protein HRbin36_02420 [bacterium HR36]